MPKSENCYLILGGTTWARADTVAAGINAAYQELLKVAKQHGGLKKGFRPVFRVFDHTEWDQIAWTDGEVTGFREDGSKGTPDYLGHYRLNLKTKEFEKFDPLADDAQ